MSLEPNRSLEFKVGLFCLIGLMVVGGLALTFGRLGEGIQAQYRIAVDFPNASGLLKGASVLMAGAKVGRVASGPEVLPDGEGVRVRLVIYQPTKIGRDARIQVGSSGLLGDRFVDVQPPGPQTTDFLADGDVVKGKREAGMSDLTREGADLVTDLRGAVAKLDSLLTKLNEEVLDSGSTENLRETFANLRTATSGFAEATGKLNTTLESADAAMASFKKAGEGLQPVVEGAKELVGKAGATVDKVGETAAEAGRTMRRVGTLVEEVRSGGGTLGALLSDRRLREDIETLIGNLRRHGVLFYKDSGSKPSEADAPASSSTRPRGPRKP